MVRCMYSRSSKGLRVSLRLAGAGAAGGALVLGALVVGEGTAGAASGTPATNLQCGSVVTRSITLNGTLTCRSLEFAPDISIGAPGVTLNLGGHTIFSGGFSEAVLVDGEADVTVTNGGEVGDVFSAAVYAESSPHLTVSHLAVSDNITSIDLTGDAHATVVDNSIDGGVYGIEAYGVSTSTVSGNATLGVDTGIYSEDSTATSFSSNTLTGGTYGFSGSSTSRSEISGNLASGNSVDGIYLDAAAGSGNLVSANRTESDGEYGVYATTKVSGVDFDQGDGYGCFNVVCIP